MVKGYWLALEKGEPGEVYNICSGRGYSIKEALDILRGYSKKNFTVKKDPSRLRPSDVPVLIGDNTKFVKRTSWHPEIPFKDTLRDTLDYWREHAAKLCAV